VKLHHIGIAVASIDRYNNNFLRPLLGYDSILETMLVEQQYSRIAFAENGQTVKMKLIEAIDENSPLYNLFKENKGGLYHIGYVSENFEEDIALLNMAWDKIRRIDGVDVGSLCTTYSQTSSRHED